MKCWTATAKKASSNSSGVITFTLGQIPLGIVWIFYIQPLRVKLYHCIFIIKVFRTIVFIFIVISISVDMSSGLLQVFAETGTFTELQTTSFIETTGVACSDSVCHNRVQVLSIPVYYSPVVRIEPATFRWLSS